MKSLKSLKEDHRGLTDAVQVVLAVVMVVVVGAIGVFIADTTTTAIDSDSNASNGITLGNATISTMLVNFLSAGKTGSSFIVILIIAAIGSIAIGYLLLFGKRAQ